MSAFFITGTDTEVGKTFISCALLERARVDGLATAAIKPIAAGCQLTAEGWQNEDAILLKQCMTEPRRYPEVNPIALQSPIAPHIAALEEENPLTANDIASLCQRLITPSVDLTLVEGAGGWRVPLNDQETLADVVKLLNIPVILVVGMKLGCLNHALLTAEVIRSDGLRLAGWVANTIDPEMSRFQENVDTLKVLLNTPCLGVVPYLDEFTSMESSHPTAEISAPPSALAARYLSLNGIV
ncbi:dethiobiotin synthase [Zooshikella harenae]|uniref:ATP-dependent dethiobiotin synthetase BioD n=1 Tax=Zooshikella harenae TaxID=2827238 RepID=A0ABS5ZFG3_9GAMM|nr:dethiobiotin synthase [Zooshikella harenae]MBU2711975.1 dethiobiotin synthase [Zooshikella harenae]